MRTIARLSGLVSTIVLGTVLLSPTSYAAKSLTITCAAESGSISYPSGTAEVVVGVTVGSDPIDEVSIAVAPRNAGAITWINTTGLALTVYASAFSNKGKLLASGSASC